MSFKETMVFMINMVKKTLQIELSDLFEKILHEDNPITKQAYSEARQKIDPKAFIELNDKLNEIVYKDEFGYKLWNVYILSAIDGSEIQLPDTELLREAFGYIYLARYKNTNLRCLNYLKF